MSSSKAAKALTGQLDWLYGTQLYGIKLGLENTQKLLTEMELPTKEQRFIHVAGTNGKGSVCAFMHSVLRAAQVRCGMFTSPHLIKFNERIQDTKELISDADLTKGLTALQEKVKSWDPHPTFFELTFAMALDWFRARKLEWIVLETGLGGRLDATNTIMPCVTVITSISLDHTQMLGSKIKDIAAEKAGIIKPGIPVVTIKQRPEAMEVIARTARERDAPLHVVTTPLRAYELGLVGQHQIWNATMAIIALKLAGFKLQDSVVREGLKSVSWPARFQTLEASSRVILDGAHNIDSCEQLVRTWQYKFPGEKATIVFGAVADKDTKALIRALQPLAARWIFTDFRSPRACPAKELESTQTSIFGQGIATESHTSLEAALTSAKKHPERVLITGSLYLAGEVLALQADSQASFQPSAQ
jgi:dihydrofolate synthase / folylpolyglutamate synthase